MQHTYILLVLFVCRELRNEGITPWGRAMLEKQIVPQLVKAFLAVYGI